MKKQLIAATIFGFLGVNSLYAFPNVNETMRGQMESFFDELKQTHNMFNKEIFYQDEKNNYLEIDLPGLNKEDIKVNYNNPELLISAKTNQEKTNFKTNREYNKKIFVGSIDESKIKVEYISGVLKIELPKEIKQQGKEIEVK